MSNHDPFAIDFAQQKNHAKQRLKAIRSGDVATLTQVKQFHSQPNKLSIDNIQLAHVQFALARELGLPSWPKLKAHTQELAHQKQAIENNAEALDKDMPTLHVRCGHDLQRCLQICGFQGDFLAMIDPLCMGPIPADEQSFLAIRAHYIVDTLIAITGDNSTAQAVASKEQHNIDTLRDSTYQRIVLWVEHDGYDQFMLLRTLQLLAEQRDTVIEIIELNHFPGSARFTGLGQLPPHAVRSLWQQRKPINARLTAQANTCWRALTSPNPKTLFDLLQQHPLDALPNIKGAIKRLLQELPHIKTGLSLTQHMALTLLAQNGGRLPFSQLFPQLQQRDPLPTLGDLMFYALLWPLTQGDKALLTVSGADESFVQQTLELTQAGQRCLDGNNKIVQHYWVGGIQLSNHTQWCWDHENWQSLKKITVP